jgi:YHS domain-containing protein
MARNVLVDPVCGMKVELFTSMWKFEFKDETYHFCSDVCKQTFISNIEKMQEIDALKQVQRNVEDQVRR